mgnify:CR=1 FL=1
MSLMGRVMRALVPRWEGGKLAAPSGRQVSVGDDLVHRAVDWWKDDAYTQLERQRHWRWLGRNWFTTTYKRTIRSDYWGAADDTVSLIRAMQTAGLVGTLDATSTIFEGGCNLGRNLFYLQNAFGSSVVGLDISEGAERERESIWRDRHQHRFVLDNALTTKFFDGCPDQCFDLVLTRWHLIHIPRSPEKQRYVEHLKRIAKTLVVIEPARDGRDDVQLFQGGTYTLSYDNWKTQYGLQEYVLPAGLNMGADTHVYYSRHAGAASPNTVIA